MSKKTRNSQDLRRHILDVSRHLLVTEGYQNLSMRKIARAIGYSPTSIYLHFENKDALVHALIDEGMGLMYAGLSEEAHTHQADPVERLRALCTRYITFGLENPEYYEIMFQLRPEQMGRYPAEKYRRARRNLDLITQALSDGSAGGVLHVSDEQVCTSAIWSALHGTASLLIARRVDVKIAPPTLAQTAVDQIVRSYLVLSLDDTATAFHDA